EVGIPRTDHTTDVLPVAFVVDELDDLLGDGTTTVAPAVGRSHQDEILIDDEGFVLRAEREPVRRHPELLDEALRVAGHRGEVDEPGHPDAPPRPLRSRSQRAAAHRRPRAP